MANFFMRYRFGFFLEDNPLRIETRRSVQCDIMQTSKEKLGVLCWFSVVNYVNSHKNEGINSCLLSRKTSLLSSRGDARSWYPYCGMVEMVATQRICM